MILFTAPEFIPNEENYINAFFMNGLEILHLRKPEATAEQIQNLLSKIDKKFHSRIMIHNHFELQESHQLKGLHFNEKSKAQIPKFKSTDCLKSMSIHHLTELEDVDASIDYVFLSPVFPSISKEGYSKQWDYESLKKELSKRKTFKVIALGGITLDNMLQIKELGFDDYALLGCIWEPIKASCSLSNITEIVNRFINE